MYGSPAGPSEYKDMSYSGYSRSMSPGYYDERSLTKEEWEEIEARKILDMEYREIRRKEDKKKEEETMIRTAREKLLAIKLYDARYKYDNMNFWLQVLYDLFHGHLLISEISVSLTEEEDRDPIKALNKLGYWYTSGGSWIDYECERD